ncbi:MAG: efflux RND transporter periplasmic adaptor subunit [Novosphingobium sp.]
MLHGALGLSLVTLAACSGSSEAQSGKKGGVPQVGYVVAAQSSVPEVISLGGRTAAFRTSEVRPQVTGLIRQRSFVEGGIVRQGQPLFQIDPSLYRAAVNQAAANVSAAQATAEAARAKADRFRPLAQMEAVSQQDYTDALAQARQARAMVAQNDAALQTAQINLRYTSVPAPIGGRIGRSLFTVGALVSASQDQPLAVIQQLDPIYVDMQQSSAELLALRQALAAGGVAPGSTAVRLKLEDGSAYAFTGSVQFSEVTVNEATGTVTLRARFPNPQGLLLPGMFVQASFEQSVDRNAFLVPQQALQRDIGGEAFILLAGKDDKVIRRKVDASRAVGEFWVIKSGLAVGDRIITQGTSNLRPGAKVRPVPAASVQRVAKPAGGDDRPGGTSARR